MARCYSQNQRYQKSALCNYNNTSQTLNPSLAGGATIVLGNTGTDTGCSIAATNSGAQVLCSGLYQIQADVTFTLVAAPGVTTFQIYKDGVALPCAQASISALADDTESVSFGTVLCVNTCSASQPTFTIVATSTTSTEITVTHAALKMVKLA